MNTLRVFVPSTKANAEKMEELAAKGLAEHTQTPDDQGGGWWVEQAYDPSATANIQAQQRQCRGCGQEGLGGL